MLSHYEIYKNKTIKYLYPSLIELGRVFSIKLNEFNVVGTFIADLNYYTLNSCLYIAIGTKPYAEGFSLTQYRESFHEFLCWLKTQDFYETDYPFEYDFHIIAVRLPETLSSSIDSFMAGEYSKMFTTEQVVRYFKTVSLPDKEQEKRRNEEIKETYAVLTKSLAYVEKYAQKINKEFLTNLSPKCFFNVELDKQPDLSKEILNY